MKKFSLIAVAFVFAALFSVSAMGQGATAAAATKLGFVDTAAFADEKEGIKTYVAAIIKLDTESKPKVQELNGIQTKVAALAKEIEDIQRAANNPSAPPIDVATIRPKQDEGQRLQREFEFKKKEYDAFIEKRGGELLGPINQEIGKALQEYAVQKGYTAIFDVEKLAQAGVILALSPASDVTSDFITFYNARPAGAATTNR